MKGTICLAINILHFHNALIPVPVKGTIQSTEALMSAFTILIPVPMKGTIIKNFDQKELSVAILIPVPMKGTILIKLGFPK